MKTIDEIRELAPSVLRSPEQGAASGVSSQYNFFTTDEIRTMLGDLNWYVYDAKQQKTKKNPETTKHMVRFRNDDMGITNGLTPEILLINSHDRTTSLSFHVGIFRIICSNGLIVADKTFDQIKVRHMGTSFDSVKNYIASITETIPNVFNNINVYDHKLMSQAEQLEFAMQSLVLRFPEYYNEETEKINYDLLKSHIDVADFIKPIRTEDSNNTLFTTMNIAQEKLMKGEFFRMGNTYKVRKARPVKNIKTTLDVNKGLWKLMESFA